MHNLPTYLTQVTLDLEAAAAAHRDVLCVCDTSVPDQCVRHLCCSQVTLDLEAAAAAHRDVLLRQHTTHDTDTANTLTVAPLQTFQPVYLQVHMYVWVRVCPHTVWACTQARPLANACTHKHIHTGAQKKDSEEPMLKTTADIRRAQQDKVRDSVGGRMYA